MTRTAAPRYATDFRARVSRADPLWPAPFVTLRREALDRFEAEGLPSHRDEDWRNTNVSDLGRRTLECLSMPDGDWIAERFAELPLADVPGARIVTVNGRVVPGLCDRVETAGVEVGSLRAAIIRGDADVHAHLGRVALAADRAFTALNTAFLDDGAYVRIADGVDLEGVIHVVHVIDATAPEVMSHPRTLIVCGANAVLRVVETYVASGSTTGYFRNAVTEIVAGTGSRLEHVRVQREADDAWHLGEVAVRQARDVDLRSTHFALGARLARVDASARLEGEGGHHALNGLYVVDGDDLVDHHTTIDHAVPHCTSHELFKGILGGRGRAVFKGRIIVRPDAQKTDAIQHNPNLLLSDDAVIHSRPQLEIYADDVRCTHGATVGQIDPEQLYYLRTRGIDADTGRDLLIHAFAGEVLDHVRIDGLRDILAREIDARLPGA